MRLVTVLGPPHSGKSTLVAAMAQLEAGQPVSIGLADAATVTQFTYLGEDWAAIEVAGGPDNLAHAGPALATSDAVVVCVPPETEAAVLSAPYLRLVEEAGLPCFLFINKIDATTERVRATVAGLQAYCRHSIILRQVPIRQGGQITGAVDLISERAWEYREGKHSALVELPAEMAEREREARTELLESLSDYDDHLLEELVEDHKPMTEEVYEVASKVLAHSDLVPAFLGAASHMNGVTRLMKSLRHEVPGVDVARARLTTDPAVSAIGSLAEMRKHLGKVVLVRVLGPGVAAGVPLAGGGVGSFTGLDARTAVQSLAPGQIALAVKSDHLHPRRLYTATGEAPLPDWARPREAMFRELIAPKHERDDARLSSALSRLAEIDPGLQIEQDAQTGRVILLAQGPLHARRIAERLEADFGVEIEQSPVPPAFRETISKPVEHHHRHRKQSGGAGQFADVLIQIRPTQRGAGLTFSEEVKGGAVPRNYIPAVEAGAMEALREGPNGFPVVDVHVTLRDGKSHSVDSSDFAFRTAGKAAVREAMLEAGPLALQPIARVEIHVPSDFTGALVPAVNGLKGQILGFDAHPEAKGWDVFQALLPATTQDDLYRALASVTRGTAWFATAFDHYQEIGLAELKRTTEALAPAV
ncbi:elongation factor G [Solirhodobacter olei]|uniref:elongation factor G n=1 Tax=Solirhodobacter olei TaxID=2493082 RepID=UPI000FD7B56F|nr:elongation factor G [Solirhodobacter olei]